MISTFRLRISSKLDQKGVCHVSLNDGGKRALMTVGFAVTDPDISLGRITYIKTTLRTRSISDLLSALVIYGCLNHQTRLDRVILSLEGAPITDKLVFIPRDGDDNGPTWLQGYRQIGQATYPIVGTKRMLVREHILEEIKMVYLMTCVDISLTVEKFDAAKKVD